MTAKTAITLTSTMTTDVKLSPKRQHHKITLSTGQDEESVVVVPGKRHKQGDTGHMLALDAMLVPAASKTNNAQQIDATMTTSTISTTTSMEQDADND